MEKTISRTSITVTFAAVLALMLSLVLPLTASAMKPDFAMAAKPGSQTIADLAINDGNFDTLVAALACEGLVPAVSGGKQLTVFAPTDAAFAKLNLNPGNVCGVEGLSDILLYHVINGRQTSNSVLAKNSYNTLSGERLTKAQLQTAGIYATDLPAKNGVVHVINSVLLPPQ